MSPEKLKKCLIALAVVYFVFPRDLIPDFLGRGLGFIDDLLFSAALIYFYRNRLSKIAAAGEASRGTGHQDSRERASAGEAEASDGSFDPYEVLGIAPSATREGIRSAYRDRMQEYHPDKVAHLGKELQDLAHHKALEIQKAYRMLCP